MIDIGEGFWNIRGSYRIAGVLDVGTQASIVCLSSGNYLMLDACDFDDADFAGIDELTDGGERLEAIVNLHPFHTLHVAHAHSRYPKAALFGSRRHHRKLQDLPWQSLTSDDPAFHAQYAADLQFSVPAGVDFISDNERVHFSSVLVYHPASATIHSNDTFNYIPAKGLVRFTPLADTVSFHPTLGSALERRPGAGADFQAWAEALIGRWGEARNLCAAHSGVLLGEDNDGPSLRARMESALAKVVPKLKRHDQEQA